MRLTDSEKRLIAAAAGIVFAYGAVALLFFANGTWIRDSQGRPLVTDFLPVFTAGKLAWAGHAATAYDWRAFHRIQQTLSGIPLQASWAGTIRRSISWWRCRWPWRLTRQHSWAGW